MKLFRDVVLVSMAWYRENEGVELKSRKQEKGRGNGEQMSAVKIGTKGCSAHCVTEPCPARNNREPMD